MPLRLPRIASEDFKAIRRLMDREFPQSFEQWEKLRSNWLKEYAGQGIIQTQVNPKDLAAFFNRSEKPKNLGLLFDFLEENDPN